MTAAHWQSALLLVLTAALVGWPLHQIRVRRHATDAARPASPDDPLVDWIIELRRPAGAEPPVRPPDSRAAILPGPAGPAAAAVVDPAHPSGPAPAGSPGSLAAVPAGSPRSLPVVRAESPRSLAAVPTESSRSLAAVPAGQPQDVGAAPAGDAESTSAANTLGLWRERVRSGPAAGGPIGRSAGPTARRRAPGRGQAPSPDLVTRAPWPGPGGGRSPAPSRPTGAPRPPGRPGSDGPAGLPGPLAGAARPDRPGTAGTARPRAEGRSWWQAWAALPAASPRRTLLLAGLVGAVAGAVLAGPVAAVAVGTYGTLGVRALLRRRAARQGDQARRRRLDQLCGLAADLRAGLPVGQVAAAPDGELDGSDRIGRLALAAVRLADRTGAPLADLVERIEADARSTDRGLAAAAAQAAGARATAVLLAALPLGGIGLGYGIGVDPLAVLLHTPVGGACGIAAIVLQVAGLFWTERLAAGPGRAD